MGSHFLLQNPRDFLDPGIGPAFPVSPAVQSDSLPTELSGKPYAYLLSCFLILLTAWKKELLFKSEPPSSKIMSGMRQTCNNCLLNESAHKWMILPVWGFPLLAYLCLPKSCEFEILLSSKPGLLLSPKDDLSSSLGDIFELAWYTEKVITWIFQKK